MDVDVQVDSNCVVFYNCEVCVNKTGVVGHADPFGGECALALSFVNNSQEEPYFEGISIVGLCCVHSEIASSKGACGCKIAKHPVVLLIDIFMQTYVGTNFLIAIFVPISLERLVRTHKADLNDRIDIESDIVDVPCDKLSFEGGSDSIANISTKTCY